MVFTAVAVWLIGAMLVAARVWVLLGAHDRVYVDAKRVPRAKVAIILGAGIYRDGRPAAQLEKRLDKGIELYKMGKVQKLLMSGDNRVVEHNEPKIMADYAAAHGVPRQDIIMDFAGRRTYDSVYRAKHVFCIDEAIIVSQYYHLDRAIFISKHIGLDAYGVAAKSAGGEKRNGAREMLACVGALIDVYIRHPKPILGSQEPIL
jgi:SanA protein